MTRKARARTRARERRSTPERTRALGLVLSLTQSRASTCRIKQNPKRRCIRSWVSRRRVEGRAFDIINQNTDSSRVSFVCGFVRAQLERARHEVHELLNERQTLLAREDRVMQMVDNADRDYRREKARFAEVERELRQSLAEVERKYKVEREARETGALGSKERESADARQLGALRRKCDDLSAEVDALKESNKELRKHAHEAKSAAGKADWLEDEAAATKERLKASESQVKELRSDLQREKQSVTKMESQILNQQRQIDRVNATVEARDGEIEKLRKRLSEAESASAAFKSELRESGSLSTREIALEKKESAIKAKEAELLERERELKDSLSKLKARESACASREKAVAKAEAKAPAKSPLGPSRGKELAGTTPGPQPTTSRFADLARKYVFTPGLNPRANSPTPTKTPSSEKSLFAVVVDKATSAAKASGSKVEAARTNAAVGMFNALQNAVGYKSEDKKIADSPKPETAKKLHGAFALMQKKSQTPIKQTVEDREPEEDAPVAEESFVEKPVEEPKKSKRASSKKTETQEESLTTETTRRARRAPKKLGEEDEAKEAPKTRPKRAASTLTKDTEEQEPKRKRGRPAKSTRLDTETEITVPETSVEATVDAVPKRGRGRPRKTVDAEASVATMETTEGDAPKRRGRPPKTKAAKEKEDEETAESPKPRKRGRPRKDETTKLADFLSAGEKEKTVPSRPSSRRSTRSLTK